jgi:hypothetical protein
MSYYPPLTYASSNRASPNRWVFNTQLPSSSQSGHTIYDPTKSTTATALTGATFNISYGDGSFAVGSVGTDTVDIGGATVTVSYPTPSLHALVLREGSFENHYGLRVSPMPETYQLE